jgi:hypothetical protein
VLTAAQEVEAEKNRGQTLLSSLVSVASFLRGVVAKKGSAQFWERRSTARIRYVRRSSDLNRDRSTHAFSFAF